MERKKAASIGQVEELPIRTDPERQHGGPQSGLPPNFIVGSELAPYLIVGIDFGTGFCSICTFTNGAPYAVQPRHFRSLVEDTLGLPVDYSRLVHSLKHCVSDNYCVKFGDRVYSAVEITAMFLRKIKAKVEENTDRLLAKAVIGVPACFNHHQREQLSAAATEAGITVLGLINEPTAAALHASYMKNLKNGKYLVVSSGAYSFEASIVDLQNKLLEIKVIKGDRSLSGIAVTRMLAAGLANRHLLEGTDHLHIAVDKAKKELEKNASAIIFLGETTVTLQQSEATEYLAEYRRQVMTLLNQLIADANLEPENICGIILTGEATKLWVLRDALIERFPQVPACSADISAGAAIHAALLVRQAKDWVVWDAIANPVLVAQGARIQEVVATNSPLPINGHCNLSPDNEGITEAAIFQRTIERENELVQVAKARVSEQLQHTESGASVDLSVMATANGTLSLSARHKELDVNLTVELVALTEEAEVIDMSPMPVAEAAPAQQAAAAELFDPGLTLEKIGSQWFVQSVVENSPAANAGINVYDELISIDDVRVSESGDYVPEMLTGPRSDTTGAAKRLALYRGSSGDVGYVADVQCTEPTNRLQPAQIKLAIADAIICGDDRRLVQALLDCARYDLIVEQGEFANAILVIKRAAETAERVFGVQDILYIRSLCEACSAHIQLGLQQAKGRDPFAALSPINKDWQTLFEIMEKHPFLPPVATNTSSIWPLGFSSCAGWETRPSRK